MRILLLLISMLSIASCSKQFKEKTGIIKIAPNEKLVQPLSRPLEIPPHYNLPAPDYTINDN